MKSFSRKVSCAIALASALLIRYQRIVNLGLVLSVILLIASEEHARRTWRDRAVESEANLTNVRKFLVLEREHVKKLAKEAQ